MLKKYTAIFCIYVSYIILLGHNIFPHGHNKTNNIDEHHHHKGIGHLFDHYMHSGDSFITNKVNIKTDITSINYIISILQADFSIHTEALSSLFMFSPPESAFICLSPHWNSSGLRAPPFVA